MRLQVAVVAVALWTGVVWAQDVVAAKSGTIHFVDGKAYRAGADLKPNKTGEFPALEPGQTLSTEEGYAEMLLTPGVFLRIAANTEVELVSNRLTDTKLKIVKGSALIEAGEVPADNKITINAGAYTALITKRGLYRFEANPDRIRVIDGRLETWMVNDATGARPVVLKKGRQLSGGEMTTAKFDAKTVDELYAWSRRRSELVAVANFSAARAAASTSGYTYTRSSLGQWVYLPMFGFFTYLPGNGMYRNVFGFNYFSPYEYYSTYYAPRPATNAIGADTGGAWGGRGGSMGQAAGGISNGGSYASVEATSAPTRSSAPAAAPSGGGGGGGGRGD
jgi:hypothetical protein